VDEQVDAMFIVNWFHGHHFRKWAFLPKKQKAAFSAE